jgi:hypothetical protein
VPNLTKGFCLVADLAFSRFEQFSLQSTKKFCIISLDRDAMNLKSSTSRLSQVPEWGNGVDQGTPSSQSDHQELCLKKQHFQNE